MGTSLLTPRYYSIIYWIVKSFFKKCESDIDKCSKMMYDIKVSLPQEYAEMRPVRGKAALVGELAVPCTCNPLQQG